MIVFQIKQEIQSIRSDCGGEFLSKDFTKLCEDVRIQRQLTSARTPKQNNMVEWTTRKLFDMARSMVLQVGTPKFLWSESINIAAFLLIVYQQSPIHR